MGFSLILAVHVTVQFVIGEEIDQFDQDGGLVRQ
jgi:hypothetical protein